MTTIYIAASSLELDRARRAMRAAEQRGYRVTYDWTKRIDAARLRGLIDADMTDEERMEQAAECEDGVDSAALFWLLVPTERTFGAPWEACHAVRSIRDPMLRPSHAFATGARGSIFVTRLLHVGSDTDGVRWLEEWRAR